MKIMSICGTLHNDVNDVSVLSFSGKLYINRYCIAMMLH